MVEDNIVLVSYIGTVLRDSPTGPHAEPRGAEFISGGQLQAVR